MSKQTASTISAARRALSWLLGSDELVNYSLKFWNKARLTMNIDLCWLWEGGIKDGRYGQFHIRRVPVYAHQAAYLLFYQTVPVLNVLHRCDNPPCVNPYHLFQGTQADNIQDKLTKGRQPYGNKCHNTKISDELVKELRNRPRKFGDITKWSKELGVSRNHLNDIIGYRKRADV